MKFPLRLCFALFLTLAARASAAVDEKFYVFLCLGQSNMEGFPGIPEAEKQSASPRFQVLAGVDFPDLQRVKGQWYPAVPPLCRPNSGLSPADYFGRTMIAHLPSDAKIGVINVSIGGCKIELFDRATSATYVANAPTWMKPALAAYDGNPYQRLIELAQLAQKDGVIKGILLHQGESNVGDSEWSQKVEKVYRNLLEDLSLKASDVPLLVGELLNADQNGACASMNSVIAALPQRIPTAHVVPSSGAAGLPDRLHFSPDGYKVLGARYAHVMLPLLQGSTAQPK